MLLRINSLLFLIIVSKHKQTKQSVKVWLAGITSDSWNTVKVLSGFLPKHVSSMKIEKKLKQFIKQMLNVFDGLRFFNKRNIALICFAMFLSYLVNMSVAKCWTVWARILKNHFVQNKKDARSQKLSMMQNYFRWLHRRTQNLA